MRILAFICLLILSGLTGLYSQDTGDVQVKKWLYEGSGRFFVL